MFNPGLVGFLINPFFIIRSLLHKKIKQNSHYIKGKILDFGCGRKPYKNLFKYDEYIGLDIEKSGHDHKDENIDIYYDGITIPFEDSYFDSIFSSESFQCIFDINNILKELSRVCKKDGYVLITVPFMWEENEAPYDSSRYTSFGLKYLFEKHNFKVIKSIKIGNYVDSIFQQISNYIYHILRFKVIRLILNPVLITPINLLGILLSKILPKVDSYFLNNLIIAKKL